MEDLSVMIHLIKLRKKLLDYKDDLSKRSKNYNIKINSSLYESVSKEFTDSKLTCDSIQILITYAVHIIDVCVQKDRNCEDFTSELNDLISILKQIKMQNKTPLLEI